MKEEKVQRYLKKLSQRTQVFLPCSVSFVFICKIAFPAPRTSRTLLRAFLILQGKAGSPEDILLRPPPPTLNSATHLIRCRSRGLTLSVCCHDASKGEKDDGIQFGESNLSFVLLILFLLEEFSNVFPTLQVLSNNLK